MPTHFVAQAMPTRISNNFRGIIFSGKAQKQDFHIYLLATPINYMAHSLYPWHNQHLRLYFHEAELVSEICENFILRNIPSIWHAYINGKGC